MRLNLSSPTMSLSRPVLLQWSWSEKQESLAPRFTQHRTDKLDPIDAKPSTDIAEEER